MRLRVLDEGHRWPARAFLAVLRRVSGHEPVDVIKMQLYRPETFGWDFSAAVQRAMRGPSDWSVGERELFAAFVSAQNRCPF